MIPDGAAAVESGLGNQRALEKMPDSLQLSGLKMQSI
jgi:hypothetical protein